eukprot:GGOE01012687.1.p1 GENE.GGOE01012687.1~~GGOE01012687.1.p1  ORF type:complete len:987 (-),score=180.53 GGOE01012687.1:1668-4628(-)
MAPPTATPRPQAGANNASTGAAMEAEHQASAVLLPLRCIGEAEGPSTEGHVDARTTASNRRTGARKDGATITAKGHSKALPGKEKEKQKGRSTPPPSRPSNKTESTRPMNKADGHASKPDSTQSPSMDPIGSADIGLSEKSPDSILEDDNHVTSEEGQLLEGVVKWYDATKGYGYIMHPVEGDVYIHVSTLEAHGLSYVSTGMLMSFMMRNNNKGKEAYDVHLVGEQPRVRGKVKSYNSDRGFGWLATKDSPVDVFVHINELRRYNLEHLRVGMTLEFCISHNAKGPTAVLVDIIDENCDRSPGVPPAISPPVRPSPLLTPTMPAVGSDAVLPAPIVLPPMAKEVPDASGTPTLQHCAAQQSPVLSPRRLSSSAIISTSSDTPPEAERSPGSKPLQTPTASRAVAPGRRFRGTVVWYSPLKGFGFLETGHMSDSKIYVHIYALEKYGVTVLELGCVLEFSVRQNHKGKFACNVVPLANFKGSGIKFLDGRRTGRLKSYDSTRMFGWIEYGDKEIFMNIYELRQDDAELYLSPGTLMEFSIGEHGRGPTAYDIDIVQLLELHGHPKEPPLNAASFPIPFPHAARPPHFHPPLPPFPHHPLHPHLRHPMHDMPPTTILSHMQEMGRRAAPEELSQSFGEPSPGPSPKLSYSSSPIGMSPSLKPVNPHLPGPHDLHDCPWSPALLPLCGPPTGMPPHSLEERPPAPSRPAQKPQKSKKSTPPHSPPLVSNLSANAQPFIPKGLANPMEASPPVHPMNRSPALPCRPWDIMAQHLHQEHPYPGHEELYGTGPGYPVPEPRSPAEGHAPHPIHAMPSRCRGTIQWCDADGGYMTVRSVHGEPVDVYVPADEVDKQLVIGLPLECSLLVIHARVEAREVQVCTEQQAVEQSLQKFRFTLGPGDNPSKEEEAETDCDWSAFLSGISHGAAEEQPDKLGIPSPLACLLDEFVVPTRAEQQQSFLSPTSSERDFFLGKFGDKELPLTVTVGDGLF